MNKREGTICAGTHPGPGVVVEGLQLSSWSRVVLQTAVRGALSRVAGQEYNLDKNISPSKRKRI